MKKTYSRRAVRHRDTQGKQFNKDIPKASSLIQTYSRRPVGYKLTQGKQLDTGTLDCEQLNKDLLQCEQLDKDTLKLGSKTQT